MTEQIDISQHPSTYGQVLERHPDMPQELADLTAARAAAAGEPGFELSAVNDIETGAGAHDWEKIAADVPLSPQHQKEHDNLSEVVDPAYATRTLGEQRAIGVVVELGNDTLRASGAEEEHEPRNAFGAIASTDLHKVQAVRESVRIPGEAKVKSLIVIESMDTAKVAQTVDNMRRNRGMEGSPEAWQEQVFGEAEIGTLKEDVLERFTVPVEQRQGEALVVNGKEKRPVMDIALSEEAKQEVAAAITAREQGLVTVLGQLQAMKERGDKLTGNLHIMLTEANVLGRSHSNLLGSRPDDNPGGTIADLYIDSEDMARFDAIDSLAGELTTRGYLEPKKCRDRLAEEVLVLASNSFPSGVELMHGINTEVAEDVVELGAIAPRSQRKHGVGNGTKNSVNGGFVHMTAPAGFASEYGTILAGIPIDTIVEHSPYMQLEDAYTGNKHIGTADDGSTFIASTQYHMGAVQLRSMENAPLAFNAAFQTMQRNISRGLLHTGIGQGNYNNFSFAAGETAETASAYDYPLQELSLYIDGRKAAAVFDAAAKHHVMDEVAERTTVTYSLVEDAHANALQFGFSLNAAELPNFGLPSGSRGMTFYAPLSSREVAFTETSAGNHLTQRAIEHTLETVKAAAVPEHIDSLVADGLPLKEAVDAAIDSVNNHGGQPFDLVRSYVGGQENFQASGITLQEIFDKLSDDAIVGSRLAGVISGLKEGEPSDPSTFEESYKREATRWINTGLHAPAGLKQQIMQAYANRLFEADPQTFASEAVTMMRAGISLNPGQQAEVATYEADQARRAQELHDNNYAPPSFSGLF